MQIAIIGTGNVGAAIVRGLKGKGHAVVLGARNPRAEAVLALAAETGAAIATPANAAAVAEVVVLALPWQAAQAAVEPLGPLVGKVVIDCMNPLALVDGVLGLAVGHTTSGGEIVQGWLPDARVVKALNQVGAEVIGHAVDMDHHPVMFMAGNDAEAKGMVARLLADLGFEALDAGGLTKARLLEPLGMVWINQALARGKGRDWAFAAVGRRQGR